MTSRYETETNLEAETTPPPERPAGSEAAYDRLTGYGFASRYVEGKVVADIGGAELGYGSRLLAETAESVTALSDLPEAINLASALYSAPNVSYRRAALPELPLSGTFFDVVVALGLTGNLEDLVKEARRVLKEEGVLIISCPDRRRDGHDRGGIDGLRGVYVPELGELLKRHFGHVHLYRQGAVAGGMVFPDSEEVTGAPVQTARSSAPDPHLGAEPPATRYVIAVCSAAEGLGDDEQTYLLLDRDRRVFDESEERAEDVELLRGEIQRMQETEVQAFVDAVRIRYNLIQELPRYLPHMQNMIIEILIHRRNIIYGNFYAIKRKGAKGLAKGVVRRSAAFYRQLKTRDSG